MTIDGSTSTEYFAGCVFVGAGSIFSATAATFVECTVISQCPRCIKILLSRQTWYIYNSFNNDLTFSPRLKYLRIGCGRRRRNRGVDTIESVDSKITIQGTSRYAWRRNLFVHGGRRYHQCFADQFGVCGISRWVCLRMKHRQRFR